MGGFRIPGIQGDPDWSIQDGTTTRAKTPAPGTVCVTKLDDIAKELGDPLPDSEKIRLTVSAYFFGGYKSSESDIDAWLNSARDQRSDVKFHGYPYPEDAGSVPPANVLNHFGSAIDLIKDDEAELIYVVGHSSGCAIANAVARRLKDNSKIALVALDGFLPDGAQIKIPDTQVWGAENGKYKSLHFDGMKSGGKDKFNKFTAHTDCTTKFALHFSLVNVASSDQGLKNDKGVEDLKNGYVDCEANLCWLRGGGK